MSGCITLCGPSRVSLLLCRRNNKTLAQRFSILVSCEVVIILEPTSFHIKRKMRGNCWLGLYFITATWWLITLASMSFPIKLICNELGEFIGNGSVPGARLAHGWGTECRTGCDQPESMRRGEKVTVLRSEPWTQAEHLSATTDTENNMKHWISECQQRKQRNR